MASGWMSEREVNTDFYEIRVTTNRPLDNTTAMSMFRSIGYAFRQNIRGEPMGMPRRVSPNCWTASYDSTKSRSDDWLGHLNGAMTDARRYVTHGTPARKTKAGTRLNAGIGPVGLVFEFR